MSKHCEGCRDTVMVRDYPCPGIAQEAAPAADLMAAIVEAREAGLTVAARWMPDGSIHVTFGINAPDAPTKAARWLRQVVEWRKRDERKTMRF